MSLRSLVALVSFASLLVPASGSTLEEATGGFVSYQFDGDSHHDAPDLCSAADGEWSAPVAGATDGILVAPDDVSDVYVLEIPSDRVGKRLNLSLLEPTQHQSLELQAFAPGCASSVLEVVNWPTPEPSPPAPSPGTRQQGSTTLEPRHCDPTRWEFWADVMPDHEPASAIHVAWTDGSEQTVPVAYTHGVAHAIYSTDHGLDVAAKGAWINMPESWAGEFFLATGPCDAPDGGAVYGKPPLAGMGFIDFTPITSGPHVVQVTYRGTAGNALAPIAPPATVDPAPYLPVEPSDLVEDPTSATDGLLGHDHDEGEGHGQPDASPGLPRGPLVVPASCHWCAGPVAEAVKDLSYKLLGSLEG